MRRKQIKFELENDLETMFDKNKNIDKYSNILVFKQKKDYLTFNKKNFTFIAMMSVLISFFIGGAVHKLINKDTSNDFLSSITLKQLEDEAKKSLDTKNNSLSILSNNNFIEKNLVINFYMVAIKKSFKTNYYYQVAELNYHQFNIDLLFNINHNQIIKIDKVCVNSLNSFINNVLYGEVKSLTVDIYSNDVFLKNFNIL